MTAQDERKEFSQRLQQALVKEKLPPESPTHLSRYFNLHWNGSPITIHAARKWIVGEAIPTQEKLRVIASMLNVKVEWLRFGSGDGKQLAKAHGVSHENLMFLAQVNALTQHDQTLVIDFVVMLRKRKDV